MSANPALLQRLQHSDPTVRRQTIVQIAQRADTSAMPALRDVFQHDPDPQLRELARRAALHIRQQHEAKNGTARADAPPAPQIRPLAQPPTQPISRRIADMRPPVPDPEPAALTGNLYSAAEMQAIYGDSEPVNAPAVAVAPAAPAQEDELPAAPPAPERAPYSGPVRGKKYVVKPENVGKAKGYVEAALSQNEKGQDDKALKSLAQALTLDPNLVNDGYFMSVAGSVTGYDDDEALYRIVNTRERKAFIRNEEKRQREKVRSDQMTTARSRENNWRAVAFELPVYGFIAAAGTFFVALVAQVAIRMILEAFIPPEGMQATVTARQAFGRDTYDTLNAILLLTPATLLALAAVNGIFQSVWLMFQGMITHVLSRMFGMVGTYWHLMTLTLTRSNRLMPFLYGLYGLVIFLVGVMFGSPALMCIYVVGFIGFLYLNARLGKSAGQAYVQGSSLGRVLLPILSIVQFIVSYSLSLAVSRAFVEAQRLALGGG